MAEMKSLAETWEAQLAGKLPFNLTYRASRVLSQLRTSRDARMLRRVRAGLRVISQSDDFEPKSFLADSLAMVVAQDKIPEVDPGEFADQVSFNGLEEIEELRAKNQGFLLTGIQPLLMAVLAKLAENGNPLVDKVFEVHENPTGHAQELWDGKGFGLEHEFHPQGADTLWCSLLGKLTATSTRVATFALEQQVPIIPLWIRNEDMKEWEVVIKPPIRAQGSPETLTMEINKQFESFCVDYAEDIDWLNHPWRAPVRQILWSRRRGNVALPEGISPSELTPFRMLVGTPRTVREACLAIPGIRALKRGRPDAHITLLTSLTLRDLWKSLAEVDDQVFIDSEEERDKEVSNDETYDLGILLGEDLEIFDLMSRLPIDRVVAMEGTDFEHLIDDILPLNRRVGPPEHGTRRYLRVAHRLGAEVIEDERLFAPVGSNYSPPPSDSKHIAVAVGSEDGDAYCWDIERFAKLLKQLSELTPCVWHLLGIPEDQDLVQKLIEHCGGLTFQNHLEEKPLTQQVQILRTTSFIIANDNMFLHLAAVCGIPGLGIFGPSEPVMHRPLGDHIHVLREHVECSPCYQKDCPLDHRCMEKVSVDQVYQVLTQYY